MNKIQHIAQLTRPSKLIVAMKYATLSLNFKRVINQVLND